MLEEAVDARFAETRQLLAEVDELAHSLKRVVIRALFRGTLGPKDVREQLRVPHLLIGHKFDEESVLRVEPRSFKFVDGKPRQAVVE